MSAVIFGGDETLESEVYEILNSQDRCHVVDPAPRFAAVSCHCERIGQDLLVHWTVGDHSEARETVTLLRSGVTRGAHFATLH